MSQAQQHSVTRIHHPESWRRDTPVHEPAGAMVGLMA